MNTEYTIYRENAENVCPAEKTSNIPKPVEYCSGPRPSLSSFIRPRRTSGGTTQTEGRKLTIPTGGAVERQLHRGRPIGPPETDVVGSGLEAGLHRRRSGRKMGPAVRVRLVVGEPSEIP